MNRSLLFAPGDDEKKMKKAGGIGADSVILDLEDSVSDSRKDLARDLVCSFIENIKSSCVEYYVRINPVDSKHHHKDLERVVASSPTGIVLPKCSGGAEVTMICQKIQELENKYGIAEGRTAILPVATETAAAVFTLGTYAGASMRTSGLTWGAEDLGAAVGASVNLNTDKSWTSPYEMVRALCLFGAHAAGVPAIDTVMADFRDLAQLRIVCDKARQDGFTGKMAIHPAQVEIINNAFSPSENEVAHAQRVLEAFNSNPEAGTLQLDGKMIDKPHIVQSQRIIKLAESIAAKSEN